MIPKNHEYIKILKNTLESMDIEIQLLKPFHYSSLINIGKMFWFRLKDFTIIHVHWLYVFPFSVVMKAFIYFCGFFGVRVIWEMHNIVPHNFNSNDAKNSKWFYEHANGIIFHSANDISRSKEMLGTDKDKKHIIIPHGNFNQSYENKISQKEARKTLQIQDDKKVILCFGFIRENRGYEYLIEATDNLLDTVVLIAGKVFEKKIYQKLLDVSRRRENVKVFGKWIPEDEVQIYFNACDIVVLPYSHITTSGVVPLAYSFSRPVITTDIGGMKDIVNEKTGILIPAKDAGALRKAIEELFSLDFKEMGKHSYEFAEKELNWALNGRKIRDFYESMLTLGN